MICRANQLTGFYMMGTLAVKRLIEKQLIKCSIISSRECLYLPKDSGLHHRSIQSAPDISSIHEHLNPWPLLDSETNEKSFPFKGEIETFKFQAISEIKNLMLKEIVVLKEAITTHSNIGVLSGKAQKEEFYQEQFRFMSEQFDRFFIQSMIKKDNIPHSSHAKENNNNNNNNLTLI